ncbi:hypothetical protein MW887_010506 [Aspergillus wentii]|nr:hypothetical protein MW887_010506 [Aspergillus wentii]
MSSTIDLAVMALPPGSTLSRSSKDAEELFRSGGLWVIQAPELKLHICITAGPEVTHCASAFSSKLGQVLCNSKLWVDLGLAVIFKSCDHVVGPNHSTIFQLSFGLCRRTKHSTFSKSLRLPAEMRCYNEAIPPIDIPTAYLATINVSLEYNYCSESPQPYISCGPMTPKLLDPLQYPIDKDENLEDDILDEQCLYFNSLPQPSNMATFKNGVSIFVEELEQLNEEWNNPPEKHMNEETFQWESNGTQSVQDFHTLFDTGFRALIFQYPSPADKRSKRSKKERSQCLSEIAPAVFSRGYREAMSQRSQFIPLIAKSLSSILDRTTDPNLLPKISALKSLNHSRSEGLPPSNAMDTRNAIKSSLWSIAQKQLYNPKASRNLSPLETAPIHDEEHPTLEGSLLAVSITDEADYAWDGDEDDTLNYDSDSLDPQEHFEIWETENGDDTLISLAEDHSIGMLDGNNTDDDQIETQDTTLCTPENADQIVSYLSPTPFDDGPLCQSGLSDSEMLASDPFDEAISSPYFCLNGLDLMDEVAGFDEDLDDMLCG